MDATRVAAIIMSIILAGILFYYSPKIIGGLNVTSLPLTNIEENPQFIWSNRGLDLLVQAFIILATAAAISAQFRREERASGGYGE
ncbi:MAG: hypothetical protein RMI78_01170 [Nitrososphaerota archaeon]|nr:hypothetical protein [Nitrososphaerota archaeon]